MKKLLKTGLAVLMGVILCLSLAACAEKFPVKQDLTEKLKTMGFTVTEQCDTVEKKTAFIDGIVSEYNEYAEGIADGFKITASDITLTDAIAAVKGTGADEQYIYLFWVPNELTASFCTISVMHDVFGGTSGAKKSQKDGRCIAYASNNGQVADELGLR